MFGNQARVHNGYHYPRCFLTALRSHVNYPRFRTHFRGCIADRFVKAYAIARLGSKVGARQFRQFCERIDVPVRPAPAAIGRLFSPETVEAVFLTEECAFDAVRLREILRQAMARAGVDVSCSTEVIAIDQAPDGERVRCELAGGGWITAGCVVLSTYSQINQLLRRSGLPLLPIKQEIAEIALIEPPPGLRELGVTVMDGPFFSTMPFPALDLHSLSHVRYTPHRAWSDQEGFQDPDNVLRSGPPQTKFPFMVRDSARYLPALARGQYARSIFEVKTVLTDNEQDNGRPILCRADHEIRNLHVVLGGKINNVYDVVAAMEKRGRFPAQSGTGDWTTLLAH